MKTTKMILLAATLVGAATMSANAGIHFGFSFGLPVPAFIAPPVVLTPAPVAYYVPAPVVVTAPAVCAPSVVVAAPACPGPDYVWAAGYYSYRSNVRVWVPGSWNFRPSHVAYYGHRSYDGYRRF